MLRDGLIEEYLIFRVMIAVEGRGTTGECKVENHICRKKCIITPYKCYGGIDFAIQSPFFNSFLPVTGGIKEALR